MDKTYVDRLITEKQELEIKLVKLRTFINDNTLFTKLSKQKQSLLKSQLFFMNEYFEILTERIKLEETEN